MYNIIFILESIVFLINKQDIALKSIDTRVDEENRKYISIQRKCISNRGIGKEMDSRRLSIFDRCDSITKASNYSSSILN